MQAERDEWNALNIVLLVVALDAFTVLVRAGVHEADFPSKLVLSVLRLVDSTRTTCSTGSGGWLLRDVHHELHELRIVEGNLAQVIDHVERRMSLRMDRWFTRNGLIVHVDESSNGSGQANGDCVKRTSG